MSVTQRPIGDVLIPGDRSSVSIPVPPEYHGGRREQYKTRYIWSGVAFIASIIVCVLYLIFGGAAMLFKLIYVVVFEYLLIFIIRRVLGEKRLRKELNDRLSRDYEIDLSNFWGIKKITENDFCYYRQEGVTGLFVLFEKGSTAGKGTAGEFAHKKAIGEALKKLGSTSNISFMHLDLMDNAGSDIRVLLAKESHKRDSDSGAKDLRTAIFNKIQADSEHTTATYDIFLFLTTNEDLRAFERDLEYIIKYLLEANFSSFRVLNYSELRNIAISLYNLNSFNLAETMREAFRSNNSNNLRLIEVVDAFGNVQKQGKTLEEEEAEKALQQRIKDKRRTKSDSLEGLDDFDSGVDLTATLEDDFS